MTVQPQDFSASKRQILKDNLDFAHFLDPYSLIITHKS
jgi:hypothetical protein